MTRSSSGPWQAGDALPPGFTTLAHSIYAGDPHWIPESMESVEQAFSTANRWFDTNQAWLGCHDGEARMAGFFNPSLTVDEQRPAFFGYFETVQQPDAAAHLFEELADWARAQGATALYGPINFTTYNAYRIKLDQFHQRAFPGEPYNRPWYAQVLEQCGFSLRYRYATRINQDVNLMMPALNAFYSGQRETINAAFDIRTVDGDFWLAHLDELYQTIDSIFGANFAYSPIDLETFRRSCGEPFARRLCPKTSVAAFDRQQRLAGFFLCFPDYSPLLNQAADSRLPAEVTNYAEHFDQLPEPRLALAKTGGVHPDYRQGGLFNALSCELSLRLQPHYQQVAGAMVREDNPSYRFAARFGDQARHYGLYWKAL